MANNLHFVVQRMLPLRHCSTTASRFLSTKKGQAYHCKLLVLGGGAGGCSIAAKFLSKVGKNNIIIVEPSDIHYYQPMLTMVGGGIKQLKESSKTMQSVLPKDATWIKDSVSHIDAKQSKVTTSKGHEISYEFMIVALGVELHYDKIKGAVEALELPGSGVCSNYSPKYAEKTYDTLTSIRAGNAVFTFPNTPIKCGGAPLKACLISEHYLRNAGRRDKTKVYYKTALPVIFTSKHYANKLSKICEERDIHVGLKEELVEIRPEQREAVFRDVDKPNNIKTIKYSMLHVTPPMYAPEVIQCDPSLHDHQGYLKINKATLQHDNYPNVFGLGDCTSLPTSKTAAAVAAQSGVLYDNLLAKMRGQPMKSQYDGYTSCPLVTGFGTCIMAEFDYSLQPLETFPFDQSKEHLSMYLMKKEVMPKLYWHAMLNGYWRGPGVIRKVLHLGISK